MVQRHNAIEDKTFEMEINEFADLEEGEFNNGLKNGYETRSLNIEDIQFDLEYLTTNTTNSSADYPSEVDWRDTDKLNPQVQN
jgi:hypothetical protein